MNVLLWIAAAGCGFALVVHAEPALAQLPTAPLVPGSQPLQEPAERPVRPLFGTGIGSFDQSLTAGLSFGGGYDVERATYRTGPGSLFDDEIVTNGMSGYGNVNLVYAASRDRFSAGASVRGSGFYYRRYNTNLRMNSGANVQAGLRLWGSSRVGVNHDMTYAPYHVTALSAAEALAEEERNPNFDPSTLVPATWHHRTGVSFDQPIPLTRRISGSAGYAFFRDRRGEFWSHHRHDLRGGLSFGLTRGLRARVGYAYSLGQPRSGGEPGPWASYHSIDSGLDFGRQLALSRRLNLSFRTGFATYGTAQSTHFTVTGAARLGWSISRRWYASGGFERDVQFYDDLHAVGVSNRLTGNVTGTLTRRLSLYGRLGMSLMNHGVGTGDNRVRWTYGAIGLSTSLSSQIRVGADYSNAYYSFGDDIVLFPGVPQHRHRHAITARLTLFTPLFVMTRRP